MSKIRISNIKELLAEMEELLYGVEDDFLRGDLFAILRELKKEVGE